MVHSMTGAWTELEARRSQGAAALSDLFRSGRLPDPAPDGRYHGRLVALNLAPGLTPLLARLTAAWMPWKGKTFDAASGTGDNIFTRDSLPLAYLYWPLYRGYVDDGPETYRAFAFRTYAAPGRSDSDREVLKIDYDQRVNPSLSIRRVLDELIQLDGGLYLGKAHLRWWWGSWQTVAYFTLSKEPSP